MVIEDISLPQACVQDEAETRQTTTICFGWRNMRPDKTAVKPDAANLSARSLVFLGSHPAQIKTTFEDLVVV